jgi:signal transduction histidine kinase/putative methionine-R-sulfoxide reductase with GAF domain
MLATSTAPKPDIWSVLQRRIVPVILLLYQFVGLGVLAITPVLAVRWMELPFIGAFTEQTLVINTVSPSRWGAWVVHRRFQEFGYQFVALNGVELHNTADMERELSRYSAGDIVMLSFRSPQGDLETHQSVLQRFPLTDRLAFFFLPYLIGLVYMVSSLWVFILRRWDETGRSFSVFATSVAIALASFFDLYTTHRLSALWVIGMVFSGGGLINLALLFPQEYRVVDRHPLLRWAGYLPATILALISFKDLFNFANPTAYVFSWRLNYGFCGLAFLFFLATTGHRLVKSKIPMVREQSRLILSGIAASFGFLVIWFFATMIYHQIRFTPLLLLPTIIFPVVNAYVILRYRLLKADYLLSRAVLYTFTLAITTVGYAMLVTGATLLLGSLLPNLNALIVGTSIFLFALLFTPLRERIQRWVDDTFAKSQTLYREALQSFSRELTQAFELSAIVALLRRYIEESFHPSQLHIFIHDPLSDHYSASADQSQRPSTDLRFAASSPLIQTLSNRRASLFFSESRTLPTFLQTEKQRLAILGIQLFIPLPGRKSLAGWIGMGPRRSGDPYGHRDLSFLETLGDQAALAIERAQVVDNLERRMHEMNVLTRIAQGINVTLAFDDILELIYAQTTNLIPCANFRIALKDTYSGNLYYVFYLENDERVNSLENHPLPPGRGLEMEVVENRRPLVTDDYERECRSRGILPSFQGIFAWAGVPLNAGAETIGVISLDSNDPSIVYTEEQVNLFQAIADQAAGAIVKAQLLRESQRRTQQLSLLNEIARSLTSTLTLKPLLNQILESAVEILNCEAGSLLLVDQTTGELVFEVAVGPVANDLIGQRMPPGKGLVGSAVESRTAIIANGARHRKDWFNQTDEQTGFHTQDLLVVPMEMKDRVIGVLEVINKKDGLAFNDDDRDLLTAFTGQAAVAIENARLYTLTDEALNARVEELSVMQRIDRELNTSLEVNRAMRITLSWAMRQSKAEAGLIGVVNEQGLSLVASEGYSDELAPFEDAALLMDLPAIQEAIHTGQAHCAQSAPDEGKFGLLRGVRGQVAVPIRRESQVIGLILLESTRAGDCPAEVLAFLSRLSDHAAIAISNAQLYTAIENANTAKSEFVSFVSHELKTPMTSIKGFTDLLAAGVVGPVNENQANFLSTIRSNVDRMATLVSDLADVSRIEAGRLKLEFGAIPVSDIVEEVSRSVRKQFEEKQQVLAINMEERLPSMWGDRTRLIQILTNLMSNAYKYSPLNGKITLCAQVADSHIAAGSPHGNGSLRSLSTGDGPKVIHISVQDTGFGISPEDQEKIFQKFFRSEDQSIRDTPGTGLGLNITKTLVEMQGGAIWFVSEYRKGTTFHFTIPIAESG